MRNPFKTYRLGRLFFVTIAGFTIILLLILMITSYKVASSSMSNQATKYQQEILNELSKRIEVKMSSIEHIALSITRNNDFLSYLNNEALHMDTYTRQVVHQKLKLYLSNMVFSWNSTIDSIEVYMDNPQPTANFPVSFFNIEKVNEIEGFEMLELADFLWVGERHNPNRIGEKNVISFARKVYSDGGDYLGLLVLNMKLSAVHDTLISIEDDREGIKRVLIGNGQTLITSTDFFQKTEINVFIAEYIQSPERYRNQKTDLNQGYLITESSDNNAKWKIIQFTPWHEIANDSFRIAYVIGGVGIIAMIFTLIVILLLSQRFMKPILIMKSAMGRFSLDMKPVSMPEDYTNEFGILFNGYSNLMARVQQLYIDLEKQYIKQKELDVKALQAMINPHFLYNTLNQINWMAIEANQPKISHILELTGKMFRLGLSNGETIVTIREELTYIDFYLKIQQIRMEPGQLQVSIDIPLALENYYVPKMLLQPFVENAIMHGFHGQDGGAIHIRVEECEEGIIFIVQDDGKGFSTARTPVYQENIGGYGIRNVRERIEALFGSTYGVFISSKPNQGTTIKIYVPKRDKGEYYID
jgi:two-component system sensor histidine kinase YesM